MQPSPATPLHREQPVFGLGLAGFSPLDCKVLECCLQPRDTRPVWEFRAFDEADGWWVNGSHTRLLADGSLRVAAGVPGEKPLRLDLSQVDRPIAFSTPLGADFEPHWRFDPLSHASVDGVLLQFESWLWLPHAQFVLGARIVDDIERLRGSVYHISYQERLLAAVDLYQGKAALRPGLRPEQLWEARWDRRPPGANILPETFVPTSPMELAWIYAEHTGRNLLPERYRRRTIYYRRAPRVPVRMLRDSHLLILAELSTRPACLDDLERQTALPRPRLERALACLYYAGAITSQQRRAAAPGQAFRRSSFAPGVSQFDGETLWESTRPPPPDVIPTAPVMLEPHLPPKR